MGTHGYPLIQMNTDKYRWILSGINGNGWIQMDTDRYISIHLDTHE